MTSYVVVVAKVMVATVVRQIAVAVFGQTAMAARLLQRFLLTLDLRRTPVTLQRRLDRRLKVVAEVMQQAAVLEPKEKVATVVQQTAVAAVLGLRERVATVVRQTAVAVDLSAVDLTAAHPSSAQPGVIPPFRRFIDDYPKDDPEGNNYLAKGSGGQLVETG